MDAEMEPRDNRLFMIIALVLTASLFLGLVGIGGLVVYRLISGPTEVAMPPELPMPTKAPVIPATPTSVPLPSATPTSEPTATLVIAPPSVGDTTATPQSGGTTAHDTPGLSSPNPDSSEMPQTGLGLMETIGLGLALVSLLGGTRILRHLKAER